MERIRVRKKKLKNVDRVSTIVDHTSHNYSVSPVNYQGYQLSGKENNLPKLSPVSFSSSDLSCSSRIVEQNQGLLEVERANSRKQPVGTTMKKLLADEMISKEAESGRRSPSVIANLMGLDWLPAQQNGNKQHKQVSEICLLKSSSVEVGRTGKMNDNRSVRKHGKGQQKVKDVHDVGERLMMDTRSNSSRATSFRSPSEDEVAFVRQKFMDVKRFSTDEKLQHSKEFHEALEVLDSNKDLLLKFLQEPDSLFAKHLHHLHGSHESRCSVRGITSSHSLKCNVDVIGSHSGEEVSKKIDISHSRKHSDKCQCNMYGRQNVNPYKLSFSLEGKEDDSYNPTRIVVLKPNLGKARNTGRSVSSATPSRDVAFDNELRNECSSLVHRESEMVSKRSRQDKFGVFVTKSGASRELAREVTRRMKDKLGADSFNVSSSGYRGYSADESSCDISENDSSYESEVTILASAASLNRGSSNKSTSSGFMESSINREAKRRLSRRWKLTNRSQEGGTSGRGSTLADMLATPDVDTGPRKPDTAVEQDEWLHRFRKDGETTELNSPLGISSRDGWKDGCIRNLSRSRSLPASSSSYPGSPRSNTRHEANISEKFLTRKKASGHGYDRSFKRDTERKWGSFSGSIRSSNKECGEMINDVPDSLSDVNGVITTIDVKNSPDVKSVILEMPSCQPDTSLPLHTLAAMAHSCIWDSPSCHDEVVPSPRMQSSVLPHDDCFDCDMSSGQQEPSRIYDADSCCLKSAAAEPESPSSSKESEQPSPISVLEAPFVEELSSGSDCFERVSEGLHGLRMQLQLLKQESEGYDEGSILISSDEDEEEEESAELDAGKGYHCIDESWESSYLLDVLADSGINKSDHMISRTWHSSDCPIGPWVFENLEKKYTQKTCSRSERRLLFDRINAGIVQIYSQHVDTERWLRPIIKNVSAQWWRDSLKTELHTLLKNDGKVREGAFEATILDGMEWLKPGDHISVVGSDIERVLIDEIIAEILP